MPHAGSMDILKVRKMSNCRRIWNFLGKVKLLDGLEHWPVNKGTA